MPPLSLTIPGRFHAGWSLLGRALRHYTGDRLRAETLQIVVLTGGALAWLMGVYAAEALAALLAWPLAPLWASLAAAGLLLMLVGGVGFRPPATVTCDARTVRVDRGRERLCVPRARLTEVETVSARAYHRRYRHYAAVHPFLGAPQAPLLLLHDRRGPALALGLSADQRGALLQRLRQQRAPVPDAPAEAASS